MYILTAGLTVVCLVSVLNCRSNTVGSDCLAVGSSRTVSPRVSGLPSGRDTCNTQYITLFNLNKNTNNDVSIADNMGVHGALIPTCDY